MLKKFLKEVIVIVVGKSAEGIVDLLDTKKYVNEFIISKKLDLTINQTRNILYKISDHGLVSSIRKKDKRKGWYTYFWKIEALKSLEFLRNDLLKKASQLESQIASRESKRFYVCETCHIEMTEENALSNNFTCNECGSVFVLKDNTKVIKEMRRNLEKLKKDMELIEVEMVGENKKIEDVRARVRKKEEKEKKDLALKAKAAKAKALKLKHSLEGKKTKPKKISKGKKNPASKGKKVKVKTKSHQARKSR